MSLALFAVSIAGNSLFIYCRDRLRPPHRSSSRLAALFESLRLGGYVALGSGRRTAVRPAARGSPTVRKDSVTRLPSPSGSIECAAVMRRPGERVAQVKLR